MALEIEPPLRLTGCTVENCRLIREMSFANPLWGAPRAYGEIVIRRATATPDIDLNGFREVVEQRRQSNYGTVQAALADPRCSRFLLTLGHMIERRGWRNEIDSEALVVLSQPMLALAGKILA